MGIRFNCAECNKRLNVKSFLAGKRGFCPNCGARVQIPLEDQPAPVGTAHTGNAPATSTTPHTSQATSHAPASQASPASHASPIGHGGYSGLSPEEARLAAAEAAAEAEYGYGASIPSAQPIQPTTDPIAEMPEAVWYVRPPSGGQYGPAKGDIMRRWIDEGRVSQDSYVWREGWDNWQEAGVVFPQLKS